MLTLAAVRTKQWPFRMWGFGEGIALRGLLAAYRVSGISGYNNFVEQLLSNYIDRGVGKGNEEHIAPGTELLLVYEATGDADFLKAAKQLAALNASFPKNKFGARMHRPDMSGWRRQIWVDCMDVDAPFLVRLGNLTGDEGYIEQGLDEILGYARALQVDGKSENAGLFWHGYEVDCGTNGQLWARGNGWALMGLVETLKLLPDTNPARPELLERLQQLCLALKRFQHTDGLWHTVVNRPDTYLESTLAVMTAYALREAFDAGLLDKREFGEMESRARAAAHGCINTEGALEWVSDATPIGELNMYATRPFGIYPWGQGPLLLMLAQEPPKSQPPSKVQTVKN
ncbi:MAG: glycoside hydrolase family 88 protein [Verrucomicrobia bacterium]|nr:glycoside hydrolase family 88 protein [Verrucomicrobiota bacterium]MDA1069426.1 glycoside hydrolase family 88 protein [Verrucomicrobiota bacterium]